MITSQIAEEPDLPSEVQEEAHAGTTYGLRNVFIEPLFKLRGEFQSFLQYPPKDFRFIVEETGVEVLMHRLSRSDLAYHTHWALMRHLPVNLLKPYLERSKRLPSGTDLTYAVLHPVFRNEPWVLDMRNEQPSVLMGSESVFRRWKWLLKSTLSSIRCRKILFELESSRLAFLQSTGWHDLEQKLVVVNSAVPSRMFRKSYLDARNSSVKLLFVNSSNITADDHFYGHGGYLAVEAFLRLRASYPNLEMVVRSSVPAPLKRKWSSIPGLRLIDHVLPWPELAEEFVTSDIFLYPTHVTSSIVLLDAMSYELPIVTTDVGGNPELVRDSYNGLLAHHPRSHQYTDRFVVQFESPNWRKIIRSFDEELVETLVLRTRSLIEDADLRRRLGQQGRREVEHGKFSIRRRNATLARVLDDAIAFGTTGRPRHGL